MSPEGLWAHIQGTLGRKWLAAAFLFWGEEQFTVQPCKNSYFFKIPSKQTQSPTRLRPAVKRLCSHLCMPEQAGTVAYNTVPWWGKASAGRNSERSSCFHTANTAPSQGQWNINWHPDMLQPSKKGSERGRVAQGWLGDVKTWKSRESLSTEWPLPSAQEPGEEQTLGVNRAQG